MPFEGGPCIEENEWSYACAPFTTQDLIHCRSLHTWRHKYQIVRREGSSQHPNFTRNSGLAGINCSRSRCSPSPYHGTNNTSP